MKIELPIHTATEAKRSCIEYTERFFCDYGRARYLDKPNTARAPIVCTSVIIGLKDNYLLESWPMITG